MSTEFTIEVYPPEAPLGISSAQFPSRWRQTRPESLWLPEGADVIVTGGIVVPVKRSYVDLSDEPVLTVVRVELVAWQVDPKWEKELCDGRYRSAWWLANNDGRHPHDYLSANPRWECITMGWWEDNEYPAQEAP